MNELVKLSDEKLNIATQVLALLSVQLRASARFHLFVLVVLVSRCGYDAVGHVTLLLCLQIYDYIDRHITKLDKDCKAFDAGKNNMILLCCGQA
jgi:hypothetical protein